MAYRIPDNDIILMYTENNLKNNAISNTVCFVSSLANKLYSKHVYLEVETASVIRVRPIYLPIRVADIIGQYWPIAYIFSICVMFSDMC